ncbi:hypothetical protein [Paenibacillus senegalensis]|uniref:hypothetical protein n=1 Tax=Paenibacillus senegalensis TaxID=1465766 RepID=UPI0002D3624A|nr:hypothetical protein [Paenibacillus senegalensis]
MNYRKWAVGMSLALALTACSSGTGTEGGGTEGEAKTEGGSAVESANPDEKK